MEEEKKEFFEKSMTVEFELEDKKRDMDLQKIKIDSLEEIVKKRDASGKNTSDQSVSQNKTIQELNLSVDQL